MKSDAEDFPTVELVMTQPKSAEERDKELVASLLSMKDDKFEIWKYFEDRADRLGDQLWSTGIWLMSLLAAALSLPFVADFVEVSDSKPLIKVTAQVPVAFIAGFGMAFCVYSYIALLDLRRHIEGNWRRAGYVRTGTWKPATWGGRKRHGWNVLVGIGIFAFLAFATLFVLALAR